jgi:hypothetical protein
VPKAIKPKADYYPLSLGDKWEYVRNENADTVWAEEVTKVEDVDGAKIATVHVQPNTPNARGYETRYKVDKVGWYFVSHGDWLYEPPPLFVKVDLKPGDTWEVAYQFVNAEHTATVKVGDPEKVSVPAGEFTAIPITTTYHTPANRQPYTNWVVSGVGMVKQIANGRVTQELKSFTPAKK